MRDVTLRCIQKLATGEFCKAKVPMRISDANYETFQESLDLGIKESQWDLYWAVMEENNVKCFLHESVK